MNLVTRFYQYTHVELNPLFRSRCVDANFLCQTDCISGSRRFDFDFLRSDLVTRFSKKFQEDFKNTIYLNKNAYHRKSEHPWKSFERKYIIKEDTNE